ncbi:hypothetical protein [Natrialba swarupiae]|uniref:Uncharacterized protein n=1 Tax=Natrialba swarupiae TaxID=2448032 RepID=A0A5D5AKV9_9EURY|nr:hypothetical protein [Natrialba swarupiae]MCW8172805.1 hypothetical protein [Natrialba swarupiae]TYT61804.1 hypothetical protein FYC77_11200 [Natrialba swarupiae]
MNRLFAGNKLVRTALTVIAALAALNYGLVEFLEYNLLADLLSFESGSTEYQASIAAVTGSAAVTLYNTVYEVMG